MRDDVNAALRLQGWRKGAYKDRAPKDRYPTPFCATQALLKQEKFYGTILEPACGEGHMSVILEAAEYVVVSSDIETKKCYGAGDVDFFSITKNSIVKNVVTNPPYRWARDFIDHALTLVDSKRGKVAMLLQLHFLGSVGRYQWFQDTHLSRIHVFSRALPYYDFKKGVWSKVGGFTHAWFVWDMAAEHKNHIDLQFIPTGKPHTSKCWDFKALTQKETK